MKYLKHEQYNTHNKMLESTPGSEEVLRGENEASTVQHTRCVLSMNIRD